MLMLAWSTNFRLQGTYKGDVTSMNDNKHLKYTEPAAIGAHTAKNRIVRSATNDHLGNMDGTISREQIELYSELAANGVGTIITGHFGVSEKYKADMNQPLLTDERFIPGAAALAECAHRHGSLIFGQISHGGLGGFYNKLDINEASEAELEEVAGQFAYSAALLEKAGYDGVQIHLAHGYFLSNVLDDTVNRRTDRFGGSDEGRFRLTREIIRRIKENCSEGFSVIVKLSANDAQHLPYDEHLLYYAAHLKEAGVDAIELSGCDFIKRGKNESAYFLPEAKIIKAHVDIPIMLVGGLCAKSEIERVLAEGMDFASMCRTFICEPDFLTRLAAGEERSKCLHCWQCFKLPKTKYKNCALLPENAKLRELNHKG